VKENFAELSEEKLFSKSRVCWITTLSMRLDAPDGELLSSEMILKMKKLIIFPMTINTSYQRHTLKVLEMNR
jgi:hypothetical protein